MARATFRKGAKVARIQKNLDKPTRALKQVGVVMTSESQLAFRSQKFGRKAWDPRGKVNLFGIIADFHAGKKAPPARRFDQRPALKDTGRLAASITWALAGKDVVEVGTNLPYANVHQVGGRVESKPLTTTVRRAFWRWLKRQGPDLKKQLGWVLNRKFKGETLKSEVPKRPFVGVTKKTRDHIREIVGVEIMEVK